MNGKGSRRRPEATPGSYRVGYEAIFGSDHRSEPASHKGEDGGSSPSAATEDDCCIANQN